MERLLGFGGDNNAESMVTLLERIAASSDITAEKVGTSDDGTTKIEDI
jgi:hypothetical protein